MSMVSKVFSFWMTLDLMSMLIFYLCKGSTGDKDGKEEKEEKSSKVSENKRYVLFELSISDGLTNSVICRDRFTLKNISYKYV